MKTKNNTSEIEKITTEINTIDDKLVEVRDQYDKVNKELLRLISRRKTLVDNKNKIIIGSSNKVNWGLLLEENGNGSMVTYKELELKLATFGLLHSGYIPEISQRAVQICMTKGDKESLANTLKGLTTVLPYIKALPSTESKGYKFVDIFEHTLSENGVYHLYVGKNDCKVTFTRYGREEIVKTAKTLKEILVYIQGNLWYNKLGADGKIDSEW